VVTVASLFLQSSFDSRSSNFSRSEEDLIGNKGWFSNSGGGGGAEVVVRSASEVFIKANMGGESGTTEG
jgi:hypothetical protein